MPAPELKRVNTLGIKLVQGRLTAQLYEKIIEDVLGIDVDDLYGIGERNDSKFLLKVNTEEKYQEICDSFTSSNITVSPGVVIEVNDISSYRTRVVVRDIPFELSLDALKLILSEYGTVEKVNRYFNYRLKRSKYEKVKTDRAIVWMDLDSPIPSSFFIKQSQTYIYANYDDQPQSCLRCGYTSHLVRNCRTKESERSNQIDLNEFEDDDGNGDTDNEDNATTTEPALTADTFECTVCEYKCNDQEMFSDHNKTHKDKTDAVLHVDPSQASEELKCTVCDYKCKYPDILRFHMETHTGEKPYICSHCGESFSSNEDLGKHLMIHSKIETHTGEKPHSCTHCDESFSTKEGLQKHLVKHSKTKKAKKQFRCKECDFSGKTSSSLKKHMKEHSGDFEISLMCSKCDLSFATEGELKLHEKCHTEEEAIDVSFAESQTFAERVKSPSPKVVNQSTPKPKLQNNSRKSIPSSQPCMEKNKSYLSKDAQKRSLSVSPEAPSNNKYARESFLKSNTIRKPSARVQDLKA